MTTFEITIIVLLVVIALFLLAIVCQFGVFLSRGDGTVWIGSKLSSINSKAQSIVDEVGQTNARIDGFIPWAKHLRQKADNLENAWACDVTSIVKYIKELTDIVDKMHRNLCVEITDKMVDRVYPPTYVTPCYAPNGICTNPQMDCINCPKRGTDGTWTTGTNINKEE